MPGRPPRLTLRGLEHAAGEHLPAHSHLVGAQERPQGRGLPARRVSFRLLASSVHLLPALCLACLWQHQRRLLALQRQRRRRRRRSRSRRQRAGLLQRGPNIRLGGAAPAWGLLLGCSEANQGQRQPRGCTQGAWRRGQKVGQDQA